MDMETRSPFHPGEQAIQSRLGVRDKMERFGRQVIRDYLPDQHRTFYEQLPFVFVGHADGEGWPWASILAGRPGFMGSPDERQLRIDTRPLAGDPLIDAWHTGTPLGLLGIELPTRRRNRLSATIGAVEEHGIRLDVRQAFGNCPQYIQTRELEYRPEEERLPVEIERLETLDAAARQWIGQADTFFVASYVNDERNGAGDGVDVSHRGGRPGFLRVDDECTLTIPDYLGNFHFNTLGNLQQNPRAGLLFLDFERGDLLMLTGTTEILWDSEDTRCFEGAERLWRFRLDHGRRIRNALPLRWRFGEYSPNSRLTGTWSEADGKRQAEALGQQWRPYRVTDVVQESSVIRSFHLEPVSGSRAGFSAGQFLTLRADVDGESLVRTYTVSSAPSDEGLRISVKREAGTDGAPPGRMSNHLHDRLNPGDVIDVRAPAGRFSFDPRESRPAVLISAGVGITPMVSMAREALVDAVKTRTPREVTLISAARDRQQRAFFDEINGMADASAGHIRACWVLSQPDEAARPGIDFHQQGRISRELLQGVLPLDDYDCYLCGPPGFMQSMYDLLRALGIADQRIHAESFGPAALKRSTTGGGVLAGQPPEASGAVVQFGDAGMEQAWTPEAGTLLEFAEAHGLTPAYGCRSGQCGACRTRKRSGNVHYRQLPECELAADEVLLCCAVPAADETGEMPRLVLEG